MVWEEEGGREITPCPDSMKKRTFVSQRFPDTFWPSIYGRIVSIHSLYSLFKETAEGPGGNIKERVQLKFQV